MLSNTKLPHCCSLEGFLRPAIFLALREREEEGGGGRRKKTDVARRNDENISDSKSHVITASKVRVPEDKSV